jgi:hypothetical protein
MCIVGQDRPRARGSDLRRDHLDQLDECQVDEQHLVFGIVHDPGDLVGKQARIERMVDRSNPKDPVPGFQMPPGVPGHGGDPVADTATVTFQALCQLQRAGADFGVVRAVKRPFDRTRYDFSLAVINCRMIDDLVAQKRPFLHHSKHMIPFGFSPRPTSNTSAIRGVQTTSNYCQLGVLHMNEFSIVLNKVRLMRV